MNRFVVITGLLLFSLSGARGQQVTVNASVDLQTISLGDWIRYSVAITAPENFRITVPQMKDSIGAFDIVQQDSITATETNGVRTYTKNFVVTKFDSGMHEVPPYIVRFTDAGGKEGSAQSNAIPVVVHGIDVDTTQAIRDVKPQLTVPMSAEEIAMYIALALAIAAAGYGLYYYMKKRRERKSGVAEEEIPAIPPHVLAMLQLDELESKGLWQQGEVKLFYSKATEIVRRYFERRYNILALEMTTGEVMEQLKRCAINNEVFTSVQNFLTDADLVKFAKHLPVASENESIIPTARAIVESTAPVVTASADEPRQEAVQA
jgi:hypothetical protein